MVRSMALAKKTRKLKNLAIKVEQTKQQAEKVAEDVAMKQILSELPTEELKVLAFQGAGHEEMETKILNELSNKQERGM